ncbi:MAG: GNAT family N-acetyltransferase [Bdellovibrionia bacterium]
MDLNEYLKVWSFAKDLESRGQVTAAFFWPPELMVAEFQTHHAFAALSEDQKEVLALILYRRFLPQFEIISLVTHPDHRQKGIMAELLRQFLSRVTIGDEVLLEVHEKNLSARNLYLKLGFKVVGERPRYYRDGAAAILMSWQSEKVT